MTKKQYDDYEFGIGGLHKIKKPNNYKKILNYDERKIYPKPFNSHKAFQRQKRGKR